jgi:hypothetical protein
VSREAHFMRTFIFAVVLTLLTVGYTSAAPRPDETISIKVNHSKSLAGGKINVRFVEMVEDSRCPRDVQCIQAGNARVRIRVAHGRRATVLTLNSNLPNPSATFEGYEFKLVGLTPEPRSNIRINPSGYVAQIEVTKR